MFGLPHSYRHRSLLKALLFLNGWMLHLLTSWLSISVGGESIYGGNFADEFHSRLRFNHRGLVACANAGSPHSNGSQFFISLDRCDWLDRKNTIFGKVMLITLVNLYASYFQGCRTHFFVFRWLGIQYLIFWGWVRLTLIRMIDRWIHLQNYFQLKYVSSSAFSNSECF